ncbi:MAG: hypothetical protein MUD02_08080 [Bacteroidales bacterium]|jgi:transcriptional regulator of arginine metabolism|nr:hypothetical protein [Bacteroidales bacterium]MCU0408891.1 hypothetical protein [Bacteroidales bacterium]
MQKAERLLAIERIISREAVSTQEALIRRLFLEGIECTQATLSRNLRQLGVSRIPDGEGGYKFAMPQKVGQASAVGMNRSILPVIREIVEARGMLVIKTLPGNASSTAYCIDGAGRYEIAGTIAGDDTILLIPRDGISQGQLHTCLELIFPGLHEQVRSPYR